MIDEPNKNDSYDSDDDDLTPNVSFNLSKASKPVQIIVVGLLVGFALFGLYLVGMGISSMMGGAQPVSNGTLDNSFCYDNSYYTSDKRNELVIYNCDTLDAKVVWIGTIEEYDAWNNMKLMDGKQHFFQSMYQNTTYDKQQFKPKQIEYKAILRYYGEYETIQSNIEGFKNNFIIVINNDKFNATIYESNIKGDKSSPEFLMTKISKSYNKSIDKTYT